MKRTFSSAVLCLLAGGLLSPAAPARADWLVTRDGGKVETRGPWKVKGKQVVFTLTDGALSSLRLTEVDLDASRQATTAVAEARAAEATKPPAQPKKAVRVLTDKDFPRSQPVPPAADGEAPAAAEGAGDAAPTGPVQVADWNQNRDQELNQIEITGSVRNNGPDLATAVSVTIRLYDVRNEVIATQQGTLATRTLKGGQNTAFKAVFPGVVDFAAAKFEVQSVPLVTRDTAADPEPAAEDAPPPAR